MKKQILILLFLALSGTVVAQHLHDRMISDSLAGKAAASSMQDSVT